MGNSSIRTPLEGIQNANLTEAEQLQIEDMFFDYASGQAFMKECKAFLDKHASGINYDEMFPIRSRFSVASDEATGQEAQLLSEVIQKMTYGFSSSEYKLN